MIQYFHGEFDGKPKRIYRENIAAFFNSYLDANTSIDKTYSNIYRQNRVCQYLQTFTLASIAQKESCDISAKLEKRKGAITKFSPQGAVPYQTGKAKVEHL